MTPIKPRRLPHSIWLSDEMNAAVRMQIASSYGVKYRQPILPTEYYNMMYETLNAMSVDEPYERRPSTKSAAKKKPLLFKKGDRVIVTRIPYDSDIGPGSIGIVMRDVTSRYDSVAVDMLRVHKRNGDVKKLSWESGHDCCNLCSIRNGKYYGYWIDFGCLELEHGVTDEDILLLMQ